MSDLVCIYQSQVEHYEAQARKLLRDDGIQPEDHPALVHAISRAFERWYREGQAEGAFQKMGERLRWLKERWEFEAERDKVIKEARDGKAVD